MARHNAKNERIKRRYVQYLSEARRLGESSVDQALAAIERFDLANRRRDFAKFHIEQAVTFKVKLADEVNARTGQRLSKATITATLKALRAFFQWLSEQPGYRRIRYSDADYFNPSNRDQRIPREGEARPSPSLPQVRRARACMPSSTDIERRDQALLAFLLLSGMRDGAVIGLKLRHLDLNARCVRQDARDIRTKFAKSMQGYRGKFT
ncbi:MAG: hypothetical protein KTR21_17765 [Rhodobacteraceae bacterium]|nr:hypothetical protein [Paracoccaceae bacterium]